MMSLQDIETRLRDIDAENNSSVTFFEYEKACCYRAARDLFDNNVDFGRWVKALNLGDTTNKVSVLLKCRDIFREPEYLELGYSKAFELLAGHDKLKSSPVYSEWLELKASVVAHPETYTIPSLRAAMTALKDKIPKKETPKQELERLRKEVITFQARIAELEAENAALQLAIANMGA